MSDPLAVQLRAGQREMIRGALRHRLMAFVARRQYGKTTTFAKFAMLRMLKLRAHTVVFGSAKLNLSREIVRKESEIVRTTMGALSTEGKRLVLTDGQTGRTLSAALSADDFAELFEAQRLEFRVFHSNNASDYSRTKVVALRPDAVGETGDLLCDEVGRIQNWRETWEAIEPIIASNREFRCLISTTPPPEDDHYSFEQLAPPPGAEFPANAAGNWYVTPLHRIHVLRLDAWDAAADGVQVFDSDTGEPITPEQSRQRAVDKDAWDRNWAVKFLAGGAAACGRTVLESAQERGRGQSLFVNLGSELNYTELDEACEWLRENLGTGRLGLGVDWATTTKGTSNPTAVAVVEQVGAGYVARLIVAWKTADPAQAESLLRLIVRAANGRRAGGRARRLCQDATNERYHAENIRKALRPEVPVESLVGSTTIDRPGAESITVKQFRCAELVHTLAENQLTLPPDRYIFADWRLVKKDRGDFSTEIDDDGRHGDTFDAVSFALYALRRGKETPDLRPTRVGTATLTGGTA